MIRLMLSLFLLISCQKNPNIKAFDPLEAMGQIQNDFAVLIDIRETNQTETAEPAISIPLNTIKKNSTLWQDFLKNHSNNKYIIVLGNTEEEAISMARTLANQDLKTGYLKNIQEWRSANLPIKTISIQ